MGTKPCCFSHSPPGCRLGEHQGSGLLETPAPCWHSITLLGTGEESDPILLLVLLPAELSPVPPVPPVQLRLGTIVQVVYWFFSSRTFQGILLGEYH